jgi:hypothetical protein
MIGNLIMAFAIGTIINAGILLLLYSLLFVGVVAYVVDSLFSTKSQLCGAALLLAR